jgi:hypothetical protein
MSIHLASYHDQVNNIVWFMFNFKTLTRGMDSKWVFSKPRSNWFAWVLDSAFLPLNLLFVGVGSGLGNKKIDEG